MSALPPKAGAAERDWRVRFVLEAAVDEPPGKPPPSPSLLLAVERGYKKFQKRFVRERVLT